MAVKAKEKWVRIESGKMNRGDRISWLLSPMLGEDIVDGLHGTEIDPDRHKVLRRLPKTTRAKAKGKKGKAK